MLQTGPMKQRNKRKTGKIIKRPPLNREKISKTASSRTKERRSGKTYEAIFGLPVDSPRVAPSAWRVIRASLPAGYSIPDPVFNGILSLNIWTKAAERQLDQEDADRMIDLLDKLDPYRKPPEANEDPADLTR